MKGYELKIIYIIGAIIALGFVVFTVASFRGNFKVPSQNISNFEECAAAGNPVMESYPRQCRANGQLFVEIIPSPEVPLK